ncbi:MAG TPA: hypothetical protein VGF40_11165, partial [Thermoanaerobaculia bacterium]
VFSLAGAALLPLSAIADDRPDWRTQSVQTAQARRAYDLTGTVVSVRGDGDGFVLRTGRQDVYVEAEGGVRVYYRGRAYRVRDLERGDRVAVDLGSSSYGRTARARSVEVLESVSDGRYGYDPYGRDDRYRRDDRYGRDDRYDRDRGRYDDSYGHRGNELLRGYVVSLNRGRDTMVVRAENGRQYEVDARPLVETHGRNWDRGVRRGEYVELRGMFHGRIFVADAISTAGYDRYGRYGRY